MKNIPNKIYLQIGYLTIEEVKEIDFTDLSGVSWSTDRIYDTDVEFVSGGASHNLLLEFDCTVCGHVFKMNSTGDVRQTPPTQCPICENDKLNVKAANELMSF